MTDTGDFFTRQQTRDVPRDQWGRYDLPDADGTSSGWTRATTFAATLAEAYGLRIWEQRQVVWGLSRRPDLITLASTIAGPEDKKALGAIVDSAHEAAGTEGKANVGTAIHSACAAVERVMAGGVVTGTPAGAAAIANHVPAELQRDVAGYFREVESRGLRIDPRFVERTVIVPQFHVAGTFDNLVLCPDGMYRVLDKKTGNLDYAEIEFAVQMALYANAKALRNYDTHQYEPMPENLATDYAIIAHITPGTGVTELKRVNIVLGWAWARTCAEVQDIRKTKHVLTPYVDDGRVRLPGQVMHTTQVFAVPAPAPIVHPNDQQLGAEVPPMSTTPEIEQAQTSAFWAAADVQLAEVDNLPFETAGAAPEPTQATAGVAGAEPAIDPATEAEEISGKWSKAQAQTYARKAMVLAGNTACDESAPDGIKLSQYKIKIAQGIVRLKNKHGLALADILGEEPRKDAVPSAQAAASESGSVTVDQLRAIASASTVDVLVSMREALGDGWTDAHQSAARLRTAQLNTGLANKPPITPEQWIAGATSPESLQRCWASVTTSGEHRDRWTPELDAAASAKLAELSPSASAP